MASNAATLIRSWLVYSCEARGRIVREEARRQSIITVLSTSFQGRPFNFNRPNVSWSNPNGAIYFTDPCDHTRRARETEHTLGGAGGFRSSARPRHSQAFFFSFR